MIKFSILVPVYNVAKYLCQCMDSIVNQTYSNLEIICIDDGSTDESGKILDEYVMRDARIQVIHKTNSGYGSSMNRGLALATGDYIGIVESDDYIAPNMYERFAEVLQSTEEQLDVVKAMYYQFTRSTCEKRELFDTGRCGKIITARDYPKLFAIPCSIWSGIYRRTFLQENAITFLETPGAAYQDTSFYFKTMMRAKKLVLLEDALLYYRTDNEGSSINSGSKLFYVCNEISEIDRYAESAGIRDAYWEGVKGAFIFRAYLWNFHRIHVGLRAAFWVEMVKEFEQIMASPEFKREYWQEWDWNEINKIMEDPEKYFWQSGKGLRMYHLEQMTSQNLVYEEMLPLYLQKQEKVVIYGAGVWAKRVWEYTKRQDIQDKVMGFVVSQKETDETDIDGKPIYEIDELTEKEALVIVAVSEKHQQNILKLLQVKGFSKVLRLDSVMIRMLSV